LEALKPEIRAWYRAGMTSHQIAAYLGTCTYGAINWIVRDIARPKGHRPGTILRPETPHADTSRRRARLLMERHLGCELDPSQHVHHVNGDPFDNRLENLTVISASDHGKLHAKRNPIPPWKRPNVRAYMRTYLREYKRRKRAEAQG
jgi:hypothetical protein